MKSRKVAGGWLIRLERGEEVITGLTAFVAESKIPCGFLQGIGAIYDAEIGYFDLRKRGYLRKEIKPVSEVINLMGNISYVDNKPFVHAHITLADRNNRLTGGHFFKGTVAVTLEIFIQVVRTKLNRYHDANLGFNFWDI